MSIDVNVSFELIITFKVVYSVALTATIYLLLKKDNKK